MLKKTLFNIAKKPLMGKMIGKVFQYCSWAFPKIYQNKDIIAFPHPQPSFENHIILSTRKPIKNLQQMALHYNQYFEKTWNALKTISATIPAFHNSFVVVANGGKRQEVQQVHFHMFTNYEFVTPFLFKEKTPDSIHNFGNASVIMHHDPNWEIHWVIVPSSDLKDPKVLSVYINNILPCIDILDAKFGIVDKGYSLVYQHQIQNNSTAYPVFHIVSGKRLD